MRGMFWLRPIVSVTTRFQFHQHFTRGFLVQKCFSQLFSSYSLTLCLFGKRILAKKLLVKCWWNWLQVLISSAFYDQLFVWKCFAQLFSSYGLALIFWQKNIGANAARKMLIKLTTVLPRWWKRTKENQNWFNSKGPFK